jgi:hypothetical protein
LLVVAHLPQFGLYLRRYVNEARTYTASVDTDIRTNHNRKAGALRRHHRRHGSRT